MRGQLSRLCHLNKILSSNAFSETQLSLIHADAYSYESIVVIPNRNRSLFVYDTLEYENKEEHLQ
jgi:hypothetical protein